jgi:mRNA interferase MazF
MFPERGDIAWVDLDPVLGTEQGGRRPALIVSGRAYHEASRRAVICPITSKIRDWPFSVPLPHGLKTVGLVLVDQVRSIDREWRLFGVIESLPSETLAEVQGRLASLTGIVKIEP